MQQDRESQTNSHDAPPRTALKFGICVGALLGLIWSICFTAIAIPAWLIAMPAEANPTVSIGQRIFQAFSVLSLAGLIGGPLISASAIGRIRRSAGKLTGLSMATVGLWLPPLTIIAAVILMFFNYCIVSLNLSAQLSSNLILVAAAAVFVGTVVALYQIVRHANRSEPHA